MSLHVSLTRLKLNKHNFNTEKPNNEVITGLVIMRLCVKDVLEMMIRFSFGPANNNGKPMGTRLNLK